MSDDDPKKARAARDEGIDRVLKHARAKWREQYYDMVKAIPGGTVLSCEDIRRMAAPIIGEPHAYQAWGAIANGAIKRGLLAKTGRMVTPKDVPSHARAIQEYYRTGGARSRPTRRQKPDPRQMDLFDEGSR